MFALVSKRLGDQWTIGDWAGLQAAFGRELPRHVLMALQRMAIAAGRPSDQAPPDPSEPPQNMKEYDPEWGRAFWTGTVGASCDHARMLSAAKAPILLTHHFRTIDPATGSLMGAVSDQQVSRARELVTGAGKSFEVVDLPEMGHAMHSHDPELFTKTIVDWSSRLDSAG